MTVEEDSLQISQLHGSINGVATPSTLLGHPSKGALYLTLQVVFEYMLPHISVWTCEETNS